jgi:hypothetical protein
MKGVRLGDVMHVLVQGTAVFSCIRRLRTTRHVYQCTAIGKTAQNWTARQWPPMRYMRYSVLSEGSPLR